MNQDTARAVARSFQDSRHSWFQIISLRFLVSRWTEKCCVIMSQIPGRLPRNGRRYHWFNFWHRRIVWRNFWITRWQTEAPKKAQRQQIWWKKSPWCICSGVGNSRAILIFAAFYNLRLDLQPYDDCVLFCAWLHQKLNGTFTTDP